MAMNVELFLDDDGTTVVESRIHAQNGTEKVFAVLQVGDAEAKALLFLYDLNTIEKMQLALASLAHELREEHDWRSDADFTMVRTTPAHDWEVQMDYADGPPF